MNLRLWINTWVPPDSTKKLFMSLTNKYSSNMSISILISINKRKVKQWRLMSKFYSFVTGVSNFFAESGNSFWVLKEYLLLRWLNFVPFTTVKATDRTNTFNITFLNSEPKSSNMTYFYIVPKLKIFSISLKSYFKKKNMQQRPYVAHKTWKILQSGPLQKSIPI